MLVGPSPSPSAEDASNVESEPLHAQPEPRKARKKRSREDRPVAHPSEKKNRRKTNNGNDHGDGLHRKKKRKDNESAVQQQEEDLDIDASAQATTTALLDAIVAAVSNSTPPEATPAPQTFVHPPFLGGPLTFTHFQGLTTGFPGSILDSLAYGSNDDILRTLQNMDVSKLPHLMKMHGGPADVSAFAPPPIFAPPRPAPSVPVPVPAGSSAILNVSQNSVARHVVIPNSQRENDHEEMLCTKWLNARKLAELVETDGLVYKKGKFSAIEEKQLTEAIETHKMGRGLTDEELHDIIFPKIGKSKDNDFWTGITRAIPLRPIIAVYHHVRRTHHRFALQGSWTDDEDGKLKQAVAELGQRWEKISLLVGRMASDCRDRYRNHILGRETRVSGAWSKEEEEELTRIVTDITIKQGRDIDNEVFWGRVSQLMGGRRGRQQCRIKWTDSLSKLIKNDGTKPRWSNQDAYILVHKVDSLNVNDDTEIDWKTLPDPGWNLWSAHTLQRRWLTMKRSIKGFEEMAHQDIVDILRVKKSHLPTTVPSPTIKKKKGRKITSATTIPEEGVLPPGDV